MDNLTHTVIGAIAGEALARYLPGHAGTAGPRRRPLYLAAGIIGGNLPDLDLLWSLRGRSQQQLAYLLDHRGHTHTVLGCLLLGVLLAAGLALWARRHGPPLTRAEGGRLLGVALFSTALHLGMDGLNSYGVHPFWPLDNGWYFGDAVYIVEPAYWFVAAPLILLARSRLARASLLGLQVLALAATLLTGRVPLPWALGWAACAALLVLACRPDPGRRAAAASAVALVLVTGAFLLGGHLARVRLQTLAATELPAGRLIDTVLSPLPANPACWSALRLSLEGGEYVARRAVVALLPAVVAAPDCRDPAFAAAGTPRWSAPSGSDATALRWRSVSMPLAELNDLARRQCRAAAFLQFARAPFISHSADAEVLGDLRFDGAQGGGFAQFRFGSGRSADDCGRHRPWTPPRGALLGLR